MVEQAAVCEDRGPVTGPGTHSLQEGDLASPPHPPTPRPWGEDWKCTFKKLKLF